MSEHFKIGAMLVQYHNVRVAMGTQSRNQILADQTGPTRENNLSSHSLMRLKIDSGNRQMAHIISRQKPGT